MEKPTTDEVGRALREGPGDEVEDEVAGRRSSAQDFLGGGMEEGGGWICGVASISVGAGVGEGLGDKDTVAAGVDKSSAFDSSVSVGSD